MHLTLQPAVFVIPCRIAKRILKFEDRKLNVIARSRINHCRVPLVFPVLLLGVIEKDSKLNLLCHDLNIFGNKETVIALIITSALPNQEYTENK